MNTLKDWLLAFAKILAMPTPATFQSIAKRSKRKFVSAALWLLLVAILSYVRITIGMRMYDWFTTLPLMIIILPISVLTCATSIHFFYKRVYHHKQNRYDEILYLTAAVFIIVLTLVIGISFIPGIVGAVLGWTMLLYLVILLTIAVKTITKLSIWETLITVLVSLIVAGAAFLGSPCLIASLTGSVEGIF